MATTGQDLERLRDAAAAFNARWKASGRKLTQYTCPCCKAEITVRQPRKSDVGQKGCWDSMTVCTACGELNYVAVWPDGRTQVNTAELAAAQS